MWSSVHKSIYSDTQEAHTCSVLCSLHHYFYDYQPIADFNTLSFLNIVKI